MDANFEDQMFSEYTTEAIISPMPPKAIQHSFVTTHHPHHHPQTIMINGDINQQLQRLPDVHQILPGNSPKMDHYKAPLEYGNVKMESPYSTKIEYINGGMVKLEPYTENPNDPKITEYHVTTNGGHYSPNSKLMEYTTSGSTTSQQHIEQHIQIFQQPQSIDGNQQNIINGTDGNFKRKSNENLNGSPAPVTINNISSNDGSSTTSPNKKPADKKKNDPNGVKKKKTR
jgi:hypothetical protein